MNPIDLTVTWNGNRIQGWMSDAGIDTTVNPTLGSIKNHALKFLAFLTEEFAKQDLPRGRYQLRVTLGSGHQRPSWSSELLDRL